MDQNFAQTIPPLATPDGISNKIIRLIKQFSKFFIVGIINTGIDFLILNILIRITGITGGYEIFVLNSISFSVAVVNSYFMNKRWTFQDESKIEQDSVKFSEFFVISVVGLILNGLVISMITSYISPMFGLSHILWANLAKVAATGISLVWNFVGYKFFVFKK